MAKRFSLKSQVLLETHDGSTRTRLLSLAYILVAMLYWAALYLYVPTLPIYLQTKTANLALVGTVLSMYGLWQAVVRFPIGISADALGRRKPFIVAGLALVGLGAWMMGSSGTIQGMLFGRAITGVAAGTWVPLLVLFGSQFKSRELLRATALLTAFGTLGRILGTGLTGFLNQLGGYPLAFFTATACAGLAAAIMLLLPEDRQPAKPVSFSQLGALVRNRQVLLPALLNAVIQYVDFAATFSFIPILARREGATDPLLSSLLSSSILVMLLGNVSATSLIHRIGVRRLLAANAVLMAVGVGGAAFASSLPLIFLCQFCISFSFGIGYPVMMGLSIQDVDEAERTTAMGLHQSVYSIGMFTGPWLSGILAANLGIPVMFLMTGVASLVLSQLGIWFLFRRPGKALAPGANENGASPGEGYISDLPGAS